MIFCMHIFIQFSSEAIKQQEKNLPHSLLCHLVEWKWTIASYSKLKKNYIPYMLQI